jgi:hypothetical protein
MRSLDFGAGLLLLAALPAGAQSAAAACAPATDSAAHQVVKTFGDLRVCMLAFGGDSAGGPRDWAVSARRVVLETQRENDRRRLMVAGDVIEWAINGQPRPVDSTSQAWRAQVVALLAPAWEADGLRATTDKLRMDIDSLPVRHDRVQAQIDSVEKRAKFLRSTIQSIRSQDRSLRNDITSSQSRLNSLNSQLNAERSKTSSSDPAVRARAEEAVRRLEEQVRRQEDIQRNAERRQVELDADKRIDSIERDLASLRPEHTAAMLRLQLRELDPSVIPELRHDLEILDAHSRLRGFDADVAAALARLRATLSSS